MSAATRKPEDCAAGCKALADADREKAMGMYIGPMRATFERSAAAWSERAQLLERMELRFNARAAAVLAEKRRPI